MTRRVILALALLVAAAPALAQSMGSSSNAGGPVVPATTVGALPVCNAGSRGTLYIVTDSLLPAALATVAAGGAVVTKVFCNGTVWIVG